MRIAFLFRRQLHVVTIERLEKAVTIMGCTQRQPVEVDVRRREKHLGVK